MTIKPDGSGMNSRRRQLGVVLELQNALYLLSVHLGECLDTIQTAGAGGAGTKSGAGRAAGARQA